LPGAETDSGDSAIPGLSELLEGLSDRTQSGTSAPDEPPAAESPEGTPEETGAGTTRQATGEEAG
jgi:hypothetical protein